MRQKRTCSIKKGVLKNFAKFTGKYLCRSLFLNKVAGLTSSALLKKGLLQRYSRELGEIFTNTVFYKTHPSDCFWWGKSENITTMGANTCSKSTVKKLKQRIRCCIVFIANFAHRDGYRERPKKSLLLKSVKFLEKRSWLSLLLVNSFSWEFFKILKRDALLF